MRKTRNIYIWQLSKSDIFRIYKAIKKCLIDLDVFSYDNLINALNSRLVDLEENINLEEMGF